MTTTDLIQCAQWGTDVDWYRETGMCGLCGNDPVNCHCQGKCGCWSLHEARHLQGQFWFALLRFVGIPSGKVCRVHWSWKCDVGQGRCYAWPDNLPSGGAA